MTTQSKPVWTPVRKAPNRREGRQEQWQSRKIPRHWSHLTENNKGITPSCVLLFALYVSEEGFEFWLGLSLLHSLLIGVQSSGLVVWFFFLSFYDLRQGLPPLWRRLSTGGWFWNETSLPPDAEKKRMLLPKDRDLALTIQDPKPRAISTVRHPVSGNVPFCTPLLSFLLYLSALLLACFVPPLLPPREGGTKKGGPPLSPSLGPAPPFFFPGRASSLTRRGAKGEEERPWDRNSTKKTLEITMRRKSRA